MFLILRILSLSVVLMLAACATENSSSKPITSTPEPIPQVRSTSILDSQDIEKVDPAILNYSTQSRKATLSNQQTISTPPGDYGKFHALVIGNNGYAHFPALKTAEGDAKAVASLLKKDYGYNVQLILNGTRRDIVSALDSMRRNLTESDNLLVYYAGHGYLDKEAERGYWLPVDAGQDTTTDWISNADITDKLKALQAKRVLVVADSCYSGTMTRGLRVTLKSKSAKVQEIKKRSRTVLTSGGLEPVTDGSGGKHSVFAAALLNALQENKVALEGGQLFKNISHQVQVNSDQTPTYSDIRKAGHDGGDFIFVRK
ncbi:MAG: caspase family protein [Magnetococcales bacterium]|nr:caspase family protein [Magnetococcales bacterium]